MKEMKLMSRDATLHPKTVQNYQQHTKRRRPRAQTKVRPMLVTQVDQRVWKAALKIANGDSTRIKVQTPTEVVVVNNSKRKK